MVFVWGQKGYHDLLGYIIFECPSCKTTGIFSVEQVRKKFTVYFVPTFSYSQNQYIVCTTCQATFKVPKELKPEVAKNLMSQDELSALVREANKKPIKSERQPQELIAESSIVENKPSAKSSIRYCPSCNNKLTKKATYCPNCGIKVDNMRFGIQSKDVAKDVKPRYGCLCCGASYNAVWWETYGAKSRCCKGLTREEQEELWNNRLNPEIPLRNCPHRL